LNLPAFCDTCGTAFLSGYVVGDGVTGLSLAGNSAGPCPKCGGQGHVPDGVFNFVDQTIEIVSAPGRTVDELSRFADIIRRARESGASSEEVAREIRESTPNIAGIADLLPKNRQDWYTFLSLLVTIVAFAMQLTKQSENPPRNIIVNQVIEQVCKDWSKQPTVTKQPPKKAEKMAKRPLAKSGHKTGRNETCPCGSGKKYKKCHGAGH
jgi:SEC-C motif